LDLIVGGGKYGCEALELLRSQHRSFVVVDPVVDCLAMQRYNLRTGAISAEGEFYVQGDLQKAVALIDSLSPEYVFPTAPVHIAADMAKIKFDLAPWPQAINNILSKLPPIVVLLAGKGRLILSFNRDNECANKCSMPTICPTSKIKKPCTMTELMRFACPDAYILISYSMAPGMGALKGLELLEFFEWTKTKEQFVVGTACDCHGVFSAFKKT
jgi:hypothetical protein